MNYIMILLIIILLVPIVLSIIRMVRRGVDTMTVLSLALSVLIMFVGIKLYVDTTDFSENFETSSKMFLLKDNGDLIAGFQGILRPEEDPIFFNGEEMNRLNNLYSKNNQEDMKGNNYKFFVVNLKAFDSAVSQIDFAGETMSRETVVRILKSDDAMVEYVKFVMEKQKINYTEEGKNRMVNNAIEVIGDKAQLKGRLFGQIMSETSKEQGSFYVINEFKKKNIKIYEETFMFKVIKSLPDFAIRYLTAKKEE